MPNSQKNIFESGELAEDSVCAKFAQTADDGKTYLPRITYLSMKFRK